MQTSQSHEASGNARRSAATNGDQTSIPTATAPEVPDYELHAQIGRGAFGEVWLARNRITGSWNALKIVYTCGGAGPTEKAIEQEFNGIRNYEPIARSDPSLMAILHVGRSEAGGFFYYVMELADTVVPFDSTSDEAHLLIPPASADAEAAEPSIARFRRFTDQDQPRDYCPHTLRYELQTRSRLSAVECIELGLRLTSALAALHSTGRLHRDLKPSNIIFANGCPKLADIGLVELSEATGTMVGTLGYVAPEGPRSERADIYSLGKVLYEASTGRSRNQYPDPPSVLPREEEGSLWAELNEVILKACETDPKDRYPSAEAMHEELALLRSGRSLRRLRAMERRFRLARYSAIALAVVGLASLLAFLYQQRISARMRALADESRDRLIRLSVAQGAERIDAGDLLKSLSSFVRALELETPGSTRWSNDLLRLEMLRRQSPKLVGFGMHDGPISYGEFSRDGKKIVTASEDGTARVWNAETSELACPPLVHLTNGFVDRAVFTPDGRTVLTLARTVETFGINTFSARVWNADTGAAIGEPLRHDKEIVSGAFSPDGSKIVTTSKDSSALFWNAATTARLLPPLRHEGTVNWASFSPDGKLLATAGNDGACRIWNIATAEPLKLLRHAGPVNQAVFSPDGSRILTVSEDATARVWDAEKGEPITPPLGHPGSVLTAAFSSDGRHILTAGGISGQKGIATVWNVQTGQTISTLSSAEGFIFGMGFSPDGRWALLLSNGSAQVWDVAADRNFGPKLRHSAYVTCASFAPDGRRILTVSNDGTWRLWDFAAEGLNDEKVRFPHMVRQALFDPTGQRILACERATQQESHATNRIYILKSEAPTNLEHFIEQPFRINQASFSTDGALVAPASFDGESRLWDSESCQPASLILTNSTAVAFSPDGKTFASGERQETPQGDSGYCARIRRTKDLEPVSGRLVHDSAMVALAYSLDGRYLAGAGYPKTGKAGIRVWFSTSGELVFDPIRLAGNITALRFSPDGRALLTAFSPEGLAPGRADLWNVETGNHIFSMIHADGVSAAQFSPDGKRIVTGSEDRSARIWDAHTGMPLGQAMRHKRTVSVVQFSPDGAKIVTGSHDGTVRIWDAETGEPLSAALPCGAMVWSVCFHPQGNKILAGSGNWESEGQLHLWSIPVTDYGMDDNRDYVEVLTGGALNETGVFRPSNPATLLGKWKQLTKTHSKDFVVGRNEQFEWHNNQAAEAERQGNHSAAQFHSRQCVKIQNDPGSYRSDRKNSF